MDLRKLALLGALAPLAGCGGSSGGAAPAVPVPQQTPSQPAANAQFSIVVPAAGTTSSARVRRAYVSAATRSVTVAIQGGAALGTFDVSAASKACTANADGSRTCVAGVRAPAGNDTFSIVAYDQPDGSGNVLARGTVVQSISASSQSTIKVSLTGVTAAISVSLQQSMPASGTSANIPVTVQALDASGNTIVGDYDRTITLTDSDTSGHTALSTTAVANSQTAVTLTYDGGYLPSAVGISASAPGISTPVVVTLQPAPSIAAQYDLPMVWSQDGSYQTGLGTSGIVQGPDGNLWIAAATASAIIKMTPSGQKTLYWTPTQGAFPQEEAVGKDGAVWFTERDGNAIGRIAMNGTITEYPLPTQYANPLGITLGPDGNIWFAEQSVNQVGKIDSGGTITEYPLNGTAVPTDLTAGPDGNLWIDESGWDQAAAIAVMSPSGQIVATHPLPEKNPQPYGIITGPDGNLWFGEYTGSVIARLTPSGQLTEYKTPSSMPGIVSLAVSKQGDIWFAESGDALASTAQLGYITPGQSTIHEVYLNMPLHVRNVTFDDKGALWYSGFYYDDSNVGEVIP